MSNCGVFFNQYMDFKGKVAGIVYHKALGVSTNTLVIELPEEWWS
ncbi:hypothetical protein [Dehalococcoides mccartyi]|nr:hypothetical protein [Dehalococcoides mccartyi]